METKHTKGEWEITDDYAFTNGIGSIQIGVKNTQDPFYRRWIADAKSSHVNLGMPNDEWLANAKLIAAAPDLLNALLVMLDSSNAPEWKKELALNAIKKATE